MRLYSLLKRLSNEELVKVAYLPTTTVNNLMCEEIYKKIWFSQIKFIEVATEKNKSPFLIVVLTNKENKKTKA